MISLPRHEQISLRAYVLRNNSPMIGEVSLEMYLRCINFCMDYIGWILAFSANCNLCKITQNFPSTKFNLHEISEKIS